MSNENFKEIFDLESNRLQAEGFQIVRVIEENKNRYKVVASGIEATAELSGKLLFNSDEKAALPAVGDWVAVTLYDNNEFAVIHEILPRKTLLERKSVNKKVSGQVIAANIDIIFIITALDADFSLNRIERYYVISASSGAKPVFLLSKSDLVDESELSEKVEAVKKIVGDNVHSYSSETGEGLDSIQKYLGNNVTFCFIGSSGVGKSTLINKLSGYDLLATQEIRPSDSEGRHTTSRRQMIFLQDGSALIDTPGMREVGLWSDVDDISEVFSDITEISEGCRFSDCSHTHEPGCAVIEAVQKGEINERRYNNFIELRKESRYIEEKTDPLKRREKKQKDKSLARVIKNFNKTRKKY